MRRTARTLWIAAGLLVGWGAASASASLVQALSLAELTRSAEHVFVGRVLSEQGLYDENERIVTDVQFQVEDAVKGGLAPGALVTVRRHGGVVGDVGTRVLGEPSFRTGESVVMFAARRNRQSALRPVGMSQGAMRVYQESGQTWVRSSAGDAAIVRRGASGTLVRAELAVPAARPLADLLSEVRSLAAE